MKKATDRKIFIGHKMVVLRTNRTKIIVLAEHRTWYLQNNHNIRRYNYLVIYLFTYVLNGTESFLIS